MLCIVCSLSLSLSLSLCIVFPQPFIGDVTLRDVVSAGHSAFGPRATPPAASTVANSNRFTAASAHAAGTVAHSVVFSSPAQTRGTAAAEPTDIGVGDGVGERESRVRAAVLSLRSRLFRLLEVMREMPIAQLRLHQSQLRKESGCVRVHTCAQRYGSRRDVRTYSQYVYVMAYHTHACRHTSTHTRAHTRTHTSTHPHTHTTHCTQLHIRAQTHTNARTHIARPLMQCVCVPNKHVRARGVAWRVVPSTPPPPRGALVGRLPSGWEAYTVGFAIRALTPNS